MMPWNTRPRCRGMRTHGANRSPDYAPNLAALEKASQDLEAAQTKSANVSKSADQLAALGDLDVPSKAPLVPREEIERLKLAGVTYSETTRADHGVPEQQRISGQSPSIT